MSTKFFSVKWYEPLAPSGKTETVSWVAEDGSSQAAKLPTSRGWHQQTVPGRVAAGSLAAALRGKGYALVSFRAAA